MKFKVQIQIFKKKKKVQWIILLRVDAVCFYTCKVVHFYLLRELQNYFYSSDLLQMYYMIVSFWSWSEITLLAWKFFVIMQWTAFALLDAMPYMQTMDSVIYERLQEKTHGLSWKHSKFPMRNSSYHALHSGLLVLQFCVLPPFTAFQLLL